MIETKGLWFMYDEKYVLNDISLEIKEQSFTAIIGANGSGKTTLAKHFNSLLLPSKGSVLVDGLDTKKHELEARKKVGFVFQNFEDQIIYPIVDEDISFGLENLGMERGQIEKTAASALERLGISHLRKSNVNTLSLGQKQMAALAGVLAMSPKYIVFDEPTTMLDARNRKNVMNIMSQINKKDKVTIILVTNQLEDLRYANNVILLKEGTLKFNGKRAFLSKKTMKEAGLDA